MDSKSIQLSQLFLRLALGFSFLSAVADRFGYWGLPGSPSVTWGNWEHFLDYSNSLNSFVSPQIGNILAIIATTLEIIFGLFLILGFKTKYTAIASGILLASFGLMMTLNLGIKPPFDYSVWTGVGASFLLSAIGNYRYSVDNLSKNK